MSWNFRKRKKIAPGIYVNFSKGGVSTSFGVKGAKVSVGKRGTYITTGVSGTGIYHRAKVGQHKSDESGISCLGTVCICILPFLISVAILGAFFGYSILTLGMGVLVSVVFISLRHTRTKGSHNVDIPEETFGTISHEIESLYSLYARTLENSDVKNELIHTQVFTEKTSQSSTEEKAMAIILNDVYKVFNNLGYKLGDNTLSELTLLMFTRKILTPEFTLDYYEIITNRKNFSTVRNKLLQRITLINSTSINNENYIFQQILSRIDENLADSYINHLYRFAVAMAYAEGGVEDVQKDFLSSIRGKANNIFILSNMDELLYDVATMFIETGDCRTASIQRHFGLGYKRAGAIMEQLQELDIIGKRNDEFNHELICKSVTQLEQIFVNHRKNNASN